MKKSYADHVMYAGFAHISYGSTGLRCPYDIIFGGKFVTSNVNHTDTVDVVRTLYD